VGFDYLLPFSQEVIKAKAIKKDPAKLVSRVAKNRDTVEQNWAAKFRNCPLRKQKPHF
jgi:hypothetical protein